MDRESDSNPSASYARQTYNSTMEVEPMNQEHDEGIVDVKPKSKAGRVLRFAALAVIVVTAIAVAVVVITVKKPVPTVPVSPVIEGCTHPVYCQGELLEAVQLSQVFPDQKTFVDMPMPNANSAQEVLDAFLGTVAEADRRNATVVRAFVDQHFGSAEDYIQHVAPRDFIENPTFLSRIQDDNIREFAHFVHFVWPNLTRMFNTSSFCSDCFSNLNLPNTFVIPGGRFREFYYWDSFWILKGLLVSELYLTARDLVGNIASLVDQFGFMPNGARIYYLSRSQPPVLSLMVDALINATNGSATDENQAFLSTILPTLVKEHEFWNFDLNTLSFTIPETEDVVKLYRYNAQTDKPRLESYLEDINTLAEAGTTRTRESLFSDIHGAAETGWDFSSRWLAPGSTNMTTIMTGRIVPLDLNIILLRGAEIIATIASAVGATSTASDFTAKADAHRTDILRAFRWSDWNDIIVPTDANTSPFGRNSYYASVATAGFAASIVDSLETAERLELSERIQVDVGGVPTSLIVSGQQWDSIDAWPPMQWFGAEAFGRFGSAEKKSDLIKKWVDSNYCGWRRHGQMFEKYDATRPGERAAGGEYLPQDGFGWTNGVVLDFISANAAELVAPNCSSL